jgi:hypothetical protein
VTWTQPLWPSSGEIFFLSGATPTSTNSSSTVYRLHQENGSWSWSKYSHGDVDCVMDLRYHRGIIFGEVQSGLSDEIHVLSREGQKEELMLYSEKEKLNTWDAKLLDDGGYVLALSKSNTLTPMELYTANIKGRTTSIDGIKNLALAGDAKDIPSGLPLREANLTKITAHNQDLADAFDLEITSKIITCKSEDSTTDPDAIFIAPTISTSKPLPTCVFIHGGAYDRTTFSFNSNSNYHHWQAMLLSLSLPSSNPSYKAKKSHSSHQTTAAVADEARNSHPGHIAVASVQ